VRERGGEGKNPKMTDKKVTALAAKLQTGGLWERHEAVEALGAMRNRQAVPALIKALKDEDDYGPVRYEAVEALGLIGDVQAVPALIEVLSDKNTKAWVRYRAIEALRLIGDPQAVPALVKALKDEDVKYTAAESLVKIGSPAVPSLLEAFKSNDKDVTMKAAEALGLIGDPQAVPALVQTLNDKNEERRVRWKAAEALGAIGTSQAVAALIEVLQDTDVNRPVHLYTIKALRALQGPQRDPQLVSALVKALKDQHLHEEAGEALVKIGSLAVPPLIETLTNEGAGWLVRCRAAQALGKIAQHHLDPALRAALPTLHRLRKRDPVFQEALKQIEAGTVAFQYLPLPAAAPLPDARSLPRPVAAADVPPDALAVPPPGFWTRLRRAVRGS